MAFHYYMNMEVMVLENAKDHIEKMTNNNMEDDVFCDENLLENNLKNGWVVITSLCSYIESVLNSILRECIGYNSKGDLMKTSIDDKLDIIFMVYKKDLTEIKSNDGWEQYKKLTKIRNELIHYKHNDMGYAGSIPPRWRNNINLAELFTKNTMKMYYEKICLLARNIVNELGLQINDSVHIFSSDGHSYTHYIQTKDNN